jgi:hypothetical protein
VECSFKAMFRIMDIPHFTDDCKLFIRFSRDSVKKHELL